MIYEGQTITCKKIENDIAELKFDAKHDSVNKFNQETLTDLRKTVDRLQEDDSIQGLLVTSGKGVFIVGADIFEFLTYFKNTKEQMLVWLRETNKIFSDLEDLAFPSVSAINGYALGGGFELALSTTYRVISHSARVGLPETKLGLFPGFGGTVRLSRVIGADNAIEWIATGKEQNPQAAFRCGAVDALVESKRLREAALHILNRAITGKIDWKQKYQEKLDPLRLNEIESLMVFEGAKAFVGSKAGPNYPAPLKAVEVMQAGASDNRDKALEKESMGFVEIAKTPTATNLVTLFLSDQYLKRKAKKYRKQVPAVKQAAVLGAGIMGGGIAYQSAYRGIPIYIKDIHRDALEAGLSESARLLHKLLNRGTIDSQKMAQTLNTISPTLSYAELNQVDIVVEAVVEKYQVKKEVLLEVESVLKENAVLASNTSSISITKLAESLERPELFCGMHFFNPVYRMPLVEIIRGEKTGEHALAQTVAYAVALGKNPIVVRDCTGFLINRLLFAYFFGFIRLVEDGVDFQRIDQIMEKFGWPMGPAYLADVIGIDTAKHIAQIMENAYPDRMTARKENVISLLFENERYGQKNGQGFYKYAMDKKGKQEKEVDPLAQKILKPLQATEQEISDEEIVERMMLPMIIECSRCLEDDIVDSVQEIDMGLIYGLAFPPFRGGALKYADSIGIKTLHQKAEKYVSLGKLYESTSQIRQMVDDNKMFYDH